MSGIAERLAGVRDRMEAACRRAGREPAEVRLIAVSKTRPASDVRAAYDAGHREFGENYAQELRDKGRELEGLPELVWHFIGPIQTNKVRYLVGRAAMVHGVDRLEAARALSDRVERMGLPPLPCLLSVNVGGEASKHGVAPEDLPALYREVRALPGLTVEGLFCLPPWSEDPEAVRPAFQTLRTLRDGLRKISPSALLPHLSMGMSHDFEVAIEEGATLVRVGTALFGERERRV